MIVFGTSVVVHVEAIVLVAQLHLSLGIFASYFVCLEPNFLTLYVKIDRMHRMLLDDGDANNY